MVTDRHGAPAVPDREGSFTRSNLPRGRPYGRPQSEVTMRTERISGDQKHGCFGQRIAVTVLLTTALLAWAPQVMASAYPTSTPSSAPVCHDGAPATVSIDAGTVTNTTTLDLSADGGTSIGDSSGGDDNLATAGDGDKQGNHDHGKGKHNKKHDDHAGEGAAAGNGGVSDASADGGAIAVQDVNSGERRERYRRRRHLGRGLRCVRQSHSGGQHRRGHGHQPNHHFRQCGWRHGDCRCLRR